MSTKGQLVRLLEEARGGTMSGAEAAAALGVSRAAVWKAVEALRAEGLEVESVAGSGYRIAPGSELLCEEALCAYLPQPAPPLRCFAEVDSTNREAKRWAVEGAPHGSMVVAQRQTAGRGRLGRSFSSPPGGLYLSVVLRPEGEGNPVLVTAAAAVAVCRAVSRLCGVELGIKWVNDLFCDGRKCCGILTEGGTGLETGEIEYMVVGIGVNYATPPAAFPPELRPLVTSLYPEGPPPHPRAALAAAIHGELLGLFAGLSGKGFLEEYRRRSIVLGREVTVMAQPPYQALAVEIDEQAHLVVRRGNGTEEALSFGEISIRPVAGAGSPG